MTAQNDTEATSKDSSVIEVEDTLDRLLTSYLHALDEYTTNREKLHQQLSAGHLALAQANFSASRGRYGQAFYDERIKAQKIVYAHVSPQIFIDVNIRWSAMLLCEASECYKRRVWLPQVILV